MKLEFNEKEQTILKEALEMYSEHIWRDYKNSINGYGDEELMNKSIMADDLLERTVSS